MKTCSNFLLGILVAYGMAGCATESGRTVADAGRTVTCKVCEHYRDLGCVNFNLRASTPRLTHEGTEYYFCGTDCRDEFQKQPAKFLKQAAAK